MSDAMAIAILAKIKKRRAIKTTYVVVTRPERHSRHKRTSPHAALVDDLAKTLNTSNALAVPVASAEERKILEARLRDQLKRHHNLSLRCRISEDGASLRMWAEPVPAERQPRRQWWAEEVESAAL